MWFCRGDDGGFAGEHPKQEALLYRQSSHYYRISRRPSLSSRSMYASHSSLNYLRLLTSKFPQYSLCDVILLFQIYYYRHKYPGGVPRPLRNTPVAIVQNENGEDQPLLGGSEGHEKERRENWAGAILKYFSALAFVCAVGALAWYMTEGADGGLEDDMKDKDVIEWRSQVIGWLSAVLYREFHSFPERVPFLRVPYLFRVHWTD